MNHIVYSLRDVERLHHDERRARLLLSCLVLFLSITVVRVQCQPDSYLYIFFIFFYTNRHKRMQS